jgi:hypothetical protein
MDYLMSVFFFMLGRVLEPQSYVIIVIVDFFLVMFDFYFYFLKLPYILL